MQGVKVHTTAMDNIQLFSNANRVGGWFRKAVKFRYAHISPLSMNMSPSGPGAGSDSEAWIMDIMDNSLVVFDCIMDSLITEVSDRLLSCLDSMDLDTVNHWPRS